MFGGAELPVGESAAAPAPGPETYQAVASRALGNDTAKVRATRAPPQAGDARAKPATMPRPRISAGVRRWMERGRGGRLLCWMN